MSDGDDVRGRQEGESEHEKQKQKGKHCPCHNILLVFMKRAIVRLGVRRVGGLGEFVTAGQARVCRGAGEDGAEVACPGLIRLIFARILADSLVFAR